MLDDELTLLDGTQVVTIGAVTLLTGRDYWVVHDLITERLPPATVLEGARYYCRDTALTLVAAVR